jgi:hypothetical protein
MKAKIIGILVVTLLISAAFPAVGTINKIKNEATTSTHNSGIEWTKSYGEDEYDVFYDVDVTDDGGYIMCGNREENGNYRPYILKVDSEGNQEWNWTIREFEFNGSMYNIFDNWATAIMQSSDDKYVSCLHVAIEFEGNEIRLGFLIKLDENGIFEWYSFLGEADVWWFIPTELIEIDTGYVVSGYGANITDPSNDYSAILIETDFSGVITDYEFYNYGVYVDEGYALCERREGGYLLTGTTYVTLGSGDYLMITTDSDLEIDYNQNHGTTYHEGSYNHDCFQTEDGGYIMGGQGYTYDSKSMDAWIVKADSDCNMVWNRYYGCDNFTDTCWSMAYTDDHKYVICVTMNFNGYSGDKEDTHLVKLDDDGKIEWIQINGGPYREVGISVKQTPDGGFIVAGRDGTSYSKDADATLTKFAPFDNEQPDKPNTPAGKKRGKVDTSYTYSTSTSDTDGDQVYYKWNWGDGNYSGWLGPYNSGDTCEASHAWTEKDDYDISVMSKDSNGGESEWSDPLSISIPRTRAYHDSLLLRILERFPSVYQFIQQLLGL